MYHDSHGNSAVLAVASKAVISGIIDGLVGAVCTFATGGSWKDVLDSFAKGFFVGFATGALDDIEAAVAAASACITVVECLINGASFEGSILAGASAFLAGIAIGSSGDELTDIMVELTFGLGLSMSAEAITVGVCKNASNTHITVNDINWSAHDYIILQHGNSGGVGHYALTKDGSCYSYTG